MMQVQSDKCPTIILHPDPPLCATKSHTVESPLTDTPYNRQPLFNGHCMFQLHIIINEYKLTFLLRTPLYYTGLIVSVKFSNY